MPQRATTRPPRSTRRPAPRRTSTSRGETRTSSGALRRLAPDPHASDSVASRRCTRARARGPLRTPARMRVTLAHSARKPRSGSPVWFFARLRHSDRRLIQAGELKHFRAWCVVANCPAPEVPCFGQLSRARGALFRTSPPACRSVSRGTDVSACLASPTAARRDVSRPFLPAQARCASRVRILLRAQRGETACRLDSFAFRVDVPPRCLVGR